MDYLKKNNTIFSFKACSPPSCGCPIFEQYIDIDGNKMISICDDEKQVVIMKLFEWELMVKMYLELKDAK